MLNFINQYICTCSNQATLFYWYNPTNAKGYKVSVFWLETWPADLGPTGARLTDTVSDKIEKNTDTKRNNVRIKPHVKIENSAIWLKPNRMQLE